MLLLKVSIMHILLILDIACIHLCKAGIPATYLSETTDIVKMSRKIFFKIHIQIKY